MITTGNYVKCKLFGGSYTIHIPRANLVSHILSSLFYSFTHSQLPPTSTICRQIVVTGTNSFYYNIPARAHGYREWLSHCMQMGKCPMVIIVPRTSIAANGTHINTLCSAKSCSASKMPFEIELCTGYRQNISNKFHKHHSLSTLSLQSKKKNNIANAGTQHTDEYSWPARVGYDSIGRPTQISQISTPCPFRRSRSL